MTKIYTILDTHTFNTPQGKSVSALFRVETNDIGVLSCCLSGDEYKIGKLKCGKGDLIIDVGAHIGGASMYAASLGCTIVAVEALPDNVELMRKNLAQTGYEQQVKIFAGAIGDGVNKTLRAFALSPEDDYSSSHQFIGFTKNLGDGSRSHNQTGGKFTDVPAISFDELFDLYKIERCRLLKSDCEGAEWAAFQAISPETLDKIDYISIELHGQNGRPTSTKEFCDLLKGKFVDVSAEYFEELAVDGPCPHGMFVRRGV